MKNGWRAVVITDEEGKTYLAVYRVYDFRGAWKSGSYKSLEPHGFTVEAYVHPVKVEGEPPKSPIWFFQPGGKSPIPLDFGGELPILRAVREPHYVLAWGRREVKTSLAHPQEVKTSLAHPQEEYVRALAELVRRKPQVFPGTFVPALKLVQKALMKNLALIQYTRTAWGYGLIQGRYLYAATPYEILRVDLGTKKVPQGLVPLSSPKDYIIVTGAVGRGRAAYGGPLKKGTWRHYVIASYDTEADFKILEAPQLLEEGLSSRTSYPWPLRDLGLLRVVGRDNPTLEIVMGPDEYRLIYTGDKGDDLISMEWAFSVEGGPKEEVRLYMGAEDITRIIQAGVRRILIPGGGFYKEAWEEGVVSASPVWEGDGFLLMVGGHRPPQEVGAEHGPD